MSKIQVLAEFDIGYVIRVIGKRVRELYVDSKSSPPEYGEELANICLFCAAALDPKRKPTIDTIRYDIYAKVPHDCYKSGLNAIEFKIKDGK